MRSAFQLMPLLLPRERMPLCAGLISQIAGTHLSNAYKYRVTAFSKAWPTALKQSWRPYPHDHRFFTRGVGPGLRHGGLVMRGIARLQYERCAFQRERDLAAHHIQEFFASVRRDF